MGKRLLAALLVGLWLLGALRYLNAALMRAVAGDARSAIWPLATAAALAFAALWTWFAGARAGREPSPRLVVATLTGVLVVGYVAFLALVPVHRFGTATTARPGTTEESYPLRGTHT